MSVGPNWPGGPPISRSRGPSVLEPPQPQQSIGDIPDHSLVNLRLGVWTGMKLVSLARTAGPGPSASESRDADPRQCVDGRHLPAVSSRMIVPSGTTRNDSARAEGAVRSDAGQGTWTGGVRERSLRAASCGEVAGTGTGVAIDRDRWGWSGDNRAGPAAVAVQLTYILLGSGMPSRSARVSRPRRKTRVVASRAVRNCSSASRRIG